MKVASQVAVAMADAHDAALVERRVSELESRDLSRAGQGNGYAVGDDLRKRRGE